MNKAKRLLLRFKMDRAYTSNDLEKVVAYAQIFLNQKKDDEGVLWLLLDSHFRMKDYEKAEEYANHLLSVRPDHSEALQKLSRIYYEREDYLAAYSFVCRILGSLDSNPEIDQLLNELETNTLFSGLAKSVRSVLCEEHQGNEEWFEWALEFKRWYEDNQEIIEKET